MLNPCRLYFLMVILIFWSCGPEKTRDIILEENFVASTSASAYPLKLSEFGFFKMPLNTLEPVTGVMPYELNAPLFSDYAFKKRFIRLPEGTKIQYTENQVFDFPTGTAIIKNFYYPADFRKPETQWRIIETRLLIKTSTGWEALPYIWNTEQTDATLEIAGGTSEVSWIDQEGVKRNINYHVPDKNQCKSCHNSNNEMQPIGPSARQLNKPMNNGINQLVSLKEAGKINDLPELGEIEKLINYDDQKASLNERARAWLESNCAHCHRKEGSAKNSGLYLLASERNPARLGIGKAPIAAGKGSGGLKYDLVPGHPESSILMYRIESEDPGIMMPELGRSIIHREGIELIREWILRMN
jgi:uncharacterized repeat protein (TIGR03806 family)